MKILCLLSAAVFSLGTPSRADGPVAAAADSAASHRFTYSVECQMIVLPQKLAVTLIPELTDETKAAVWPRLPEMIARGDATLAVTLLGQGVAGAKLNAGTIVDFRYPTQFDPPHLPDTSRTQTYSPDVLKNWPFVGVAPTATEARSTGPMLEMEVDATTDPTIVYVNFVVRHVRLERMEKIDVGRLANGERLTLEQPLLSEMRSESSITLKSGVPKLVGVHNLPESGGSFEIFVLTLRLSGEKVP